MSTDDTPASPPQDLTQRSEPIDPVGFEYFRNDDGSINHDLLDTLIDLREFTDSLPETRATFRLSEINAFDGRSNSPLVHAPPMTILTGTWAVPDHYASSDGTARQYVNPNYAHRRTYSDAFVRCSCGSLIDEGLSKSRSAHADSCTYLDSLRAAVELWERREQIICNSLAVRRRHDYIWARLDVGKTGLKYYTNQLGINHQQRFNEARAELGRLAADAHENYSYNKLRWMFDMSHKAVSRAVREFAEADDE